MRIGPDRTGAGGGREAAVKRLSVCRAVWHERTRHHVKETTNGTTFLNIFFLFLIEKSQIKMPKLESPPHFSSIVMPEYFCFCVFISNN